MSGDTLGMDTPHTTKTTQEPALYSINTTLKKVFPEKSGRPSLRTFNEWRARGYYPYVKVGKRVFLCPVQVRLALEKRFTIDAKD
ncbi:MAG: hypothetical protein ACQKBY_10035 [Verrucomicrobiales bacterium]